MPIDSAILSAFHRIGRREIKGHAGDLVLTVKAVWAPPLLRMESPSWCALNWIYADASKLLWCLSWVSTCLARAISCSYYYSTPVNRRRRKLVCSSECPSELRNSESTLSCTHLKLTVSHARPCQPGEGRFYTLSFGQYGCLQCPRIQQPRTKSLLQICLLTRHMHACM